MFRNIFVMMSNLVFLSIGGSAMYYSAKAITTPRNALVLDVLNRNRHITKTNFQSEKNLIRNSTSVFWMFMYVLSCCVAFTSFLGVVSAVLPYNSLRIYYYRAARDLAVCMCIFAAIIFGITFYDSGGKLLARLMITCCSTQRRNSFIENIIDHMQRKFQCCGFTSRTDYVNEYMPLSCKNHQRGCYFAVVDRYFAISQGSLKNYLYVCMMVSCVMLIPAVTISCAYSLIDRTECVRLPAMPRCRKRCAQVYGENRCPTAEYA